MDEIEIINLATTPRDIAAVKRLFVEYSNWLGVDMCFQGFDEEMETFPEVYKLILLARVNGKVAGAIGLKDLGDGICEMKRLYVRDIFKGTGLGRRLVDRVLAEARALAFTSMRLDTLPRLERAIGIYRKLGFEEIEAYYHNPIDGVIYMELSL